MLLSDLVGEVPEVQPVTNISTAADLLKQGAGEFPLMSQSRSVHVYTEGWFNIWTQP